MFLFCIMEKGASSFPSRCTACLGTEVHRRLMQIAKPSLRQARIDNPGEHEGELRLPASRRQQIPNLLQQVPMNCKYGTTK